MSWIELTADAIRSRFTELERSALAGNENLGETGYDPLTEIIAQVTDLVRGYVAGCASNPMGPDGTIPSRLLDAAVSAARYKFVVRLPLVLPAFVSERRKEYEDAIALFKDVAACKFAVDTLGDGQTSEPTGNTSGRGRSGSAFKQVYFPQ